MKKTTILLSTALLLSFSAIGMAQPPSAERGQKRSKMTPEQREAKHAERSERRLAKLTEKLSLTPTQALTAKQLFQDSHNNMKRLRESGNDMRSSEMREARHLIRKETREKVSAMLTAEQRETFKTMKGKRGHHGDRGQCDGKKGKRGKHGKKGKDASNIN